MTNPISFAGASPRFGLPLLFAAQAQKEIYVNEALALTDALLHCAIEGTATAPPAAPTDGTNWLVATGATGVWAGADGKLACLQGGNWVFVTPRDGMVVLHRAHGQTMRYAAGWQAPALTPAPTGGTVVDAQARTTVAGLIAALQVAGVLPAS